jgi:hypothetical protein
MRGNDSGESYRLFAKERLYRKDWIAKDRLVESEEFGGRDKMKQKPKMILFDYGGTLLREPGWYMLRGERALTTTEITDIHFRELTDREILGYIATGEPMDKAGSYGIQGGAALFAEKLHGDYYNVMGLPVCRLGQLLKQIAPELMEDVL